MLGTIIGLMFYAFSTKDRRGYARNLSIALEKPADDPEIRRIVRRIFINYGQYMVDFFMLPQLSMDKVKKRFAFIKGERFLKEALEKGKGAIVLSPHLGNWEIGGHMIRALDYSLGMVVMSHNTDATNALANRLRGDNGINVFEMDSSPFSGIDVLQYLRENGIVAMNGDKDFFGNGRTINYFNTEVSFPVGPVVLAMKSGADLIPAFVLKNHDGKYFGVMEEPVQLTLDGDRDTAIEENLERTARVFEKYIRDYPDQWYCPDPIADEIRK